LAWAYVARGVSMGNERPPNVGQTSGLPVKGTSGSARHPLSPGGRGSPRQPEPGLRSKPQPSDRRSDPPNSGRHLTSRLVAGLHSRGALPHLKREGASYFVTFRLAGTLPKEIVLGLKREREAILQEALAHNRPLTWNEQRELFNWYSERVDSYLDAGHGDCRLKRPEVAKLVADALRFFDGERYDLHAWVVMPNHVHVVVHPEPPHTLSSILKSWKTYTAVHGNRILNRVGQPFWQNESYDHSCRDQDDHGRCSQYTLRNPAVAGLCADPRDWPWSSAHVGQTSGLPVAGTSGSISSFTPFEHRSGQPSPENSGLRSKPQPSDRRSDPHDDPHDRNLIDVPGRPQK
jgi:putative transposase